MTGDTRRGLAAGTVEQRPIPQTRRVIFVRHAHTAVDAGRPPSSWRLSAEGRAAAGRLPALALFEHAAGLYAGPEPRHAETLVPLLQAEWARARGLTIQVDDRLAEGQTGGWLDDGAFQAAVERFFSDGSAPAESGWETANAAASRFRSVVQEAAGRHPPTATPGHVLPGTWVIASGGRAIIAYLASVLGWHGAEALARWKALRLPDVAVLELADAAMPRRDGHLVGERAATAGLPAGGGDRLVIPFGCLAVG